MPKLSASSRRSSLRCAPADGDARRSVADERYRAHRAVRRLLELLAAERPLVLVLDDLHWSDGASIELLGALLRRGTRRSGSVRGRIPSGTGAGSAVGRARGAVGATDRARAAQRGARDAAAARARCRRRRAAIYRHGGGNPFYLEQLARTARRDVRDAGGAARRTAQAGSPAGGRGVACRGARLARGGGAHAARGRGRRRRAVRSRSRGGDRRAVAGGGARRARRAARARPPAPDAGTAALRLPPSARPARGLRVRARRLEARCARARGGRAGGARGARRVGAGAPRGAVRRAGRRGGDRAAVRSRRRGRAARARRWQFAGSKRRFASYAPPTTSVRSTSASLLPRRYARSASSSDAARRCSRRSSCCRRTRASGTSSSRRCAPQSSTGSGATRKRTSVSRAHGRSLPNRSTAGAAALQIELAVDGLYELEFRRSSEMGRDALETARALGDRALVAAAASALCLGETAAGRIETARELPRRGAVRGRPALGCRARAQHRGALLPRLGRDLPRALRGRARALRAWHDDRARDRRRAAARPDDARQATSRSR